MKKFLITLLSVLILVTGLAFVTACNNGGDVLSSYLLKEDGTLVEADFELPKTVGGKDVTWVSDKEAIAIEDGNEAYIAKVNLGDVAETVKLTVNCGKSSKDFEVTVAALDVYYFAKKYDFKVKTAVADFKLDTSYTLLDKTATIAWSVDKDEDKTYINISDDGKTCLVNPTPLNPEVRLSAEFSYNGKTTKVPYRVTISFEREHLEEVDYWYYNTGVSIEMKGYVIAIATAYAESYNNVSLYMVNDEFDAGYYLYRVKLTNASDAALLEEGVHVTVTGSTNTKYSGLMETNSDGFLVVDKDKDGKVIKISDEDKAKLVYALDEDLLAGSPATIYNQSRLVSLKNWKVDSVEKAPGEGLTATLFTLKKGSVSVKVSVSKYMEGAYITKAGDTTWEAIAALTGTIKAGDIVSVSGVLGYNGGSYQIFPMKADDVKKEEGAETPVADALTNAGKAIKAVSDIFAENGISYQDKTGYIIVSNKDVTVPATSNGVEIEYKLLRPSASVVIADGESGNKVLKITADKEDIAALQIIYTVKDGENVVYTTTSFHNIHSMQMDDAAVVKKVRFDLEVKDKEIFGNMDLTTAVAQYPGATISWALKEPVDGVTVSADGKKLNVKPSTEVAKNVTLVATITYNSASDTKEFKITVIKVDPVETGTFVMFMDVKSEINKKLYFTGEFDGDYGATSDSPYDAAQVVIEEATDGYTMKVNGKYLELNSKHLIVLSDESNGVWGYDYLLKVFTWDVADYGVCVIGTYTNNNKTFTTISASKVSYIEGDNASKIGVTQFPVSFEKPTEDNRTDAEKAEAALAKVKETLTVSEAGETVLPVSSIEGVTLAWSIKTGEDITVPEGVTISEDGLKINVTALPEEDLEVVLILKSTCGEASAEKEVTVTIKAAPKEEAIVILSVAQANEILNGLASGETYKVDGVAKKVYVKGYVTVLGSRESYGYKNLYIADAADAAKDASVLIYSTNAANDVTLAVGDLIVVYGYLMDYSGTKEISSTKIDGVSDYAEITEVATISSTKASEILNGLASGETYKVDGAAKKVYVKGYVTVLGSRESYGYKNLYIADAADAAKEASVLIYSTNAASDVTLAVGDFIIVYGYLMDYSGTKEISSTKIDGVSDYAEIVGVIKASEPEPEPEQPAGVPSALTFGSEDRANDPKISSYTGSYEAKRGDFTYTIAGFNNNNNGWDYIKCGSKNADTTATITTQKVAPAVTKVVVTIDKVTAANVKSFKLKVYSDAALTQAVAEVSCTIAEGENTFTIDADKVGEGYYYQIEIDCTKSSSNGIVQLSKVELFTAENA